MVIRGARCIFFAAGEVDLCTENPGRDVDLYINTKVRTLVDIWHGDLPIKTALRQELVKQQGDRQLARTMPDWLGICLYADVQAGEPGMTRVVAGRIPKKQALPLKPKCYRRMTV